MRRRKANHHGEIRSTRHEAKEVEEGPEEGQEEQGASDEDVVPRRITAREGRRAEADEVESHQGGVVVRRDRLTSLDDALRLLGLVRDRTDRILVGLSGGKDSLTVLDLCVRVFGAKNVSAFYMYLVRDLRCAEMTIHHCERRYKIDVHRFPHWRMSLIYQNAMYMPHWGGVGGRLLKQVDIEMAAREASGCDWIAYGHRLADSIERIAMLKRCGGLDEKGRRVYPVMRWYEGSVYSYLRRKKIPLPPKLSLLKRNMTGVNFHEDTLLVIRDRFPDDFAKIIEVFPYLPARLARFEMQKGSWKQKTYIDRFKTSLRDR
jgi:phosphoadenosine phosphosulfate reductase